ncbi:polysaccharide deacetylase family protein [Microbacterium sp. SSW1-49]|uniref:Polysaccharide deacetylase family protein n=1 Tax=Microbacterium croceum TaxID=2851645 RepID=A0ABT0FG55_9MICO|nr:polysaccharide deacetylase family protein [Microbacterium croceum]MCK2037050.1 polysaccharide deacetylase family protein [Microbacterium croceum]
MRPSERLDYSPISERPHRTLPDGKKVAVWVIVNIEEWKDDEPMPRTVLTPPAGGVPTPDVPNWCWHEYGNRVGFWRLLKVLDAHGIPVVLAVNGSAVATYPAISNAALERGWEFMGHGYGQKNMQKVPNEREDIRRTTEAIRAVTGKDPRGWLGPGLTETWETPEILVENGYEYVCDWVLDDEPVELRTETTPLTSIPYTQECNDVAMMLIQHHPAREYLQRATDQYNQLAEDAEESARVMALVVHPYIMAAPHRLTYFDQALTHIRNDERSVFMTGEQILDWHRATAPLPAMVGSGD